MYGIRSNKFAFEQKTNKKCLKISKTKYKKKSKNFFKERRANQDLKILVFQKKRIEYDPETWIPENDTKELRSKNTTARIRSNSDFD